MFQLDDIALVRFNRQSSILGNVDGCFIFYFLLFFYYFFDALDCSFISELQNV